MKIHLYFNYIFREICCFAHRDYRKSDFYVNFEIICNLIMSAENWDKLNVEREKFRKKIAKLRKIITNAQHEFLTLKNAQKKLRTNANAIIARENSTASKKNFFETFEIILTNFKFFDLELFFLFESIFFYLISIFSIILIYYFLNICQMIYKFFNILRMFVIFLFYQIVRTFID